MRDLCHINNRFLDQNEDQGPVVKRKSYLKFSHLRRTVGSLLVKGFGKFDNAKN
jgi:hypothetical protein